MSSRSKHPPHHSQAPNPPRARRSQPSSGYRRAVQAVLIALGIITLLALQQDVLAQARELFAHLSTPELVLHQLPLTAEPCVRQTQGASPPSGGLATAAHASRLPDTPGEATGSADSQGRHTLPTAADVAASHLLHGAQVEIEELQEELGKLRRELVQARAVSAQLREQVQRARHARARTRSQPPATSPEDPVAEIERRLKDLGFSDVSGGRSSGSFERSFRLSEPRVQFLGSDAWITGQVTNHTQRQLQPLVVIELLRSGELENRRELRLLVPPGATVSYEARIPTVLAEGTYSARVRVEA